MRDVRADLQFPLSGSMMKQRLREHERWAAAVLAHVKDAQLQTVLNRVIASMRAAQKQIPDGFAHHMHCVAYYTQNNKTLDTVLIKEEPEQAEPAGLLARTPQKRLQMLGREAGCLGRQAAKSLRARLWSGTASSGSVKRSLKQHSILESRRDGSGPILLIRPWLAVPLQQGDKCTPNVGMHDLSAGTGRRYRDRKIHSCRSRPGRQPAHPPT